MTTTEGNEMSATESSYDDAVHVTRISKTGDVYGHSTKCCDEGGCAGLERYFGLSVPGDFAVGEVASAADIAALPAYDATAAESGRSLTDVTHPVREPRAVR